jgi:two-component system, NarL family, nitrate/nitrite response regulator NarL
MTCAKLLLCDDHPPIRAVMALLAKEINKQIGIVEAGNAAQALAMLETHPDIDLVLLDLHMPGMSGLDLLAELKVKHPSLPVVVLSSDETRASVVAALERGATGYICKSSPMDLLAKFLEHALDGNITLPTTIVPAPSVEQAQAPAPNVEPAQAPVPSQTAKRQPVDLGLTPRQMDVLGCLLRGMSGKQICRELGIAEGTEKSHTVAVFRALNVTNRAQAVIEASRRGVPIGEKPR